MHSPSKHPKFVSTDSRCHHFAVWVNIYKLFSGCMLQPVSELRVDVPVSRPFSLTLGRRNYLREHTHSHHCQLWMPGLHVLTHTQKKDSHTHTDSHTQKRSLNASEWPLTRNSFLFKRKLFNFEENFVWQIPCFHLSCVQNLTWLQCIKKCCFH